MAMSAVSGLAIAEDSATSIEATVNEVLRDVPLIDGHNDAPWAIRSRVKNQIADFDFLFLPVDCRHFRTHPYIQIEAFLQAFRRLQEQVVLVLDFPTDIVGQTAIGE